ncbi:RNA binding motif protein 12Bb [Dunckerocampus dactyliophorus]|uniref:RNA binding motif protein 12Bb n=1 Tax=Dunckerocampus dactyliophorus TaxID=161453 RepID=UPI002406DCE5|nr:RNA binding motif protein 12Bb [Dunckerocampus dactyliophorus]XP_054629081.1 RNA binding motif protein 12Bb [Dunckerocampus dactyliophorus]
MAVVIRLQGLRITAGSQEIRKFFTGLKIPDGGVHIIGGEREEAFIIFASDEDARRAMTRSGGQIRGGRVTLLLSSKTEMQSLLEKSAKKVETNQKSHHEDNGRHARRSMESDTSQRAATRHEVSPPTRQQRTSNDKSLCVFLKGLPFTVTEREVSEFFSGLRIIDMALLKNQAGKNNGMGLVKFSSNEEALEALKRDREYIGSRYVEVSPSSEEDWRRTAGRHPMAAIPEDGRFERHGSPLRGERIFHHHTMRSHSPTGQQRVSSEEFCVLVENLSFAVETEDIKRLFRHANLEDDQILFMNAEDRKSRSAFVLFKTLREYREATAQEKKSFFNRWIHTRSISREKMISILEEKNINSSRSGNTSRLNERPPSLPRDPNMEKVCLYVQNLPFDVRKVEVMDFFYGFSITEENVLLLRDSRGAGTGKALVLFPSESAAMRALSLNGQRYLGAEVALKCISQAQMRELSAELPAFQGPQRRFDQFPGAGDFRSPRADDRPMNAGPQTHRVYDECYADSSGPLDRGNSTHERDHFGGPTCVKLFNLPFQIRTEEIYDFCHGYRIIPGSVSLQYDSSGAAKGTATVVFETRQEAVAAIEDLNARPIGARKIQLRFV